MKREAAPGTPDVTSGDRVDADAPEPGLLSATSERAAQAKRALCFPLRHRSNLPWTSGDASA